MTGMRGREGGVSPSRVPAGIRSQAVEEPQRAGIAHPPRSAGVGGLPHPPISVSSRSQPPFLTPPPRQAVVLVSSGPLIGFLLNGP